MTGTAALTAAAMLAFAANSLFCRLALGEELIDAASFTFVRTFSGAVMLAMLVIPAWRKTGRPPVNGWAVCSLFTYMVFFSFAYRSLGAGTGALVLFGAVQLTMFAWALRQGERFSLIAWVGFLLAIGGLVYLLLPGLTAPDLLGSLLMVTAGLAWGVYSLLGRSADDPLSSTANNFIYCIPLAGVASLVFMQDWSVSWQGVVLAIASGALASGLGYVAWYAALRGLSASRAATVQLSVPVIAAIGGVLILSEPFTQRLLFASLATLGGIGLVLRQRHSNG